MSSTRQKMRGGVCKFVFSYVDRQHCQSVKKLRIWRAGYFKESRESMKPYLKEIDEAAKFLQKGPIKTNHGDKHFICYFIADCKCADIVIGLQGGSATRPCVYCKIKSSEWNNIKAIPESEMRTMDEIKQAGLKIEKAEAELLDGKIKKAELVKLKKECNSVNATPSITNIPIENFVPDTVHLNMHGVNTVIEHCSKEEFKERSSVLLDEIEQLGLPTESNRSEYNGPNCSKILKHFENNSHLQGYGINLLRRFAKVQEYAVAKDLEEHEIDALDKAIKEFFDLMDQDYPKLAGKKTKLHMLRFHVMPFVRTHKSWGKFSAEALEGSHKFKNQVDQKIQGKKQSAKDNQMEYFMNQHMLLNHFTNELD